jgi:hypothetical protein
VERARGGPGRAARSRRGVGEPGQHPAVCRSSYINPRTFDLFRSGITIERAVIRAAGPGWESPDLGDPAEVARVVAELGGAPGIERAVLRMLKE